MGIHYSVYCMNDQGIENFEQYYRNTLVPQLCKKRKIFEPTIVYTTLEWRLKTKNTDHIDGIDNQTTSNNATFLLQPEHTLKETQYIFNNNPITIAITVISSPEIPIISPPKNNTATPLQWLCECGRRNRGCTIYASLFRHIKLCHKKDGVFVCPQKECLREFERQSDVIHHLSEEHNLFKICCRQLWSNDNYAIHKSNTQQSR